MLVLLLVALRFILRGYLFSVLPCVICSYVFQSFQQCDYLAWGERANLNVFRTFVRFALVWFCLFPLPVGVWEGLRLVIVTLPGLFSYLFRVWHLLCYYLVLASPSFDASGRLFFVSEIFPGYLH